MLQFRLSLLSFTPISAFPSSEIEMKQNEKLGLFAACFVLHRISNHTKQKARLN